jgi:hypothetical protein
MSSSFEIALISTITVPSTRKIGPSCSNFDSIVKNSHFQFPFKKQTLPTQFNTERPLIDNFLESISQGIMQSYRTPDDLSSYI